jgi:predicted nucleotidyltransferase
MHEWHKRAIEKLKRHFEANQSYLAVILVGSVAREEASEESDVDFVLVATDDEYATRAASRNLFYAAEEFTDATSQQASGYIVDLPYLMDAAERADERTRFQFVKAQTVFSRIARLQQLVARISTYPEKERPEKMKSFYSQLPLHFSFMELAEYSQNAYLLSETAVAMVLFGGRLILAHNRMLYPGRKWFMREFERAPDKPEGIIALATELLRHPGIAPAKAFYDRVTQYTDWPLPEEGTWQRIHEDSVWNWRYGQLSPAEK